MTTITHPTLTASEVDTTTALVGALHDATDDQLEQVMRALIVLDLNANPVALLASWAVKREQDRRDNPGATSDRPALLAAVQSVSATFAALTAELSDPI